MGASKVKVLISKLVGIPEEEIADEHPEVAYLSDISADELSKRLSKAADAKLLDAYFEALELGLSDIRQASAPVSMQGKGEDEEGEIRGCVHIEKTEERAITVRQLQDVVDHLEANHRTWKDGKGELLLKLALDINLYDVTLNYICPQTKHHQCAYVELVAKGRQLPKWYHVSLSSVSICISTPG